MTGFRLLYSWLRTTRTLYYQVVTFDGPTNCWGYPTIRVRYATSHKKVAKHVARGIAGAKVIKVKG